MNIVFKYSYTLCYYIAMQYIDFNNELNEKQYEAVSTSSQFVRVVAGAGSGKTRVLTFRIAYLLSQFEVKPWNILAITFTNKVAKEMKTRINTMLGGVDNSLSIRTFHSFGAFFLRQEIESIGFPSTFTILDEEDQTKMIKDIASEMGYKRSDKIVGKALSYIAHQKLKGLYPDEVKLNSHIEDEKTCLEIYTRYEENKERIFSLDFDDLILKTNEILSNFPTIRMKWANKFSHILIDEFQDTNDVEYKLISLLMTINTSLYVVGDPDQTIYTWRGANQKIILDLQRLYPGIETIYLERNYRSTQNILNSANKLIKFNKLRLDKNLYTETIGGEPIISKGSPSGKSEADYIVREIQKLVSVHNYKYSDIAILYRSNYVSLEFETALTSRNIPYRLFGGQKFYQRREIKDVLAYFHLIVNTKDDVSFERIVNVPRRAIGEQTLTTIKLEAKQNNTSIYEHIKNVDETISDIPKKALNSLKALIKVIDLTRDDVFKGDEVFSKTLEEMITSIGYYDYLTKDDDGNERIENVKALFADLRHYLKSNPESTFDEYLQNIALLSAQDEINDGDFVSLMTVHTAKGLEFPVVFVVRFNNSVFPSNRAMMENGFQALEEERRLAYVAITRAKERLYLSFSNDYSYVVGGTLSPSVFLEESGNIPQKNFHSSYQGYKTDRPQEDRIVFDDGNNSGYVSDVEEVKSSTNGLIESDWSVGDIVFHKSFGQGVVVELEGDGILSVRFENHGIKSIMGNHPSIKKGGEA